MTAPLCPLNSFTPCCQDCAWRRSYMTRDNIEVVECSVLTIAQALTGIRFKLTNGGARA